MSSKHTHYDNLKVARNAPPEVIRAAYKSLAQKYHPDRYADKAEAERIIKIINAAYEVLCDPIQRAQYDVTLAQHETKSSQEKNLSAHSNSTTPIMTQVSASRPSFNNYSDNSEKARFRRMGMLVIVYGAVGILAIMLIMMLTNPSSIKPIQTQAKLTTNDTTNSPELPSSANSGSIIQNPQSNNDSTIASPNINASAPTTTSTNTPNIPTTQNIQNMRPSSSNIATPSSQTTTFENAEKLYQASRYVEAELMTDTLLQQTPNHAPTWRLKAFLQASRGNVEKATHSFEMYLRVTNNSEVTISDLNKIQNGEVKVAANIRQAAGQALMHIGR